MHSLAVDQSLELRAEFLDSRNDWNSARIAEHANRRAGHQVREIQERVEVFHRPLPVADSLEDLRRPRGAFAALRALSAALMGKEAREPGDDPHHRLFVVDDDDAAGAEHRPLSDEALVIHQRRVRFRHCLNRYRRPARDDSLELSPVTGTAAELMQKLAERAA